MLGESGQVQRAGSRHRQRLGRGGWKLEVRAGLAQAEHGEC